ncbi:hypothetical protein N0V93_005348 [Gnomoniopsis smithogilvyi]|uniref:Uncharacterized protein n=1 Tax=Gnomoniopsis smithogilvyi TaxID=1191159 RepID=A0A9W9CX21_9PEZI|nr:hypothetical protein N0V93_005348 [Gnomoniopsis smithogilvyi]
MPTPDLETQLQQLPDINAPELLGFITLLESRSQEYFLPSRPCTIVMGEAADPIPSLIRTATPPPHQKTHDANGTEIIVLAIGILFLVSQLILIIWLFAPWTFARKPREQRIIIWRPVDTDPVAQEAIVSNEDVDQSPRRPSHRRSSTWNGRSTATSQDQPPLRRRKSSCLKPAGSRNFSASDQGSDLSDRDSSVREVLRDASLAAASLAIPLIPLSSRRLRSRLSSPEPEPESDGANANVREIRLPPARFSPRSPRLGPRTMAAMSTILGANERKPGTTSASSPATDATDLMSSSW